MQLLEEGPTIHAQSYLCSAPGGSARTRILEVTRMASVGLPSALAGLLCTADLQGRDLPTSRLFGEALADAVAEKISADEVGVLLAGDFYASEGAVGKMGASGDVRSVWRKFAERFRWVVGVAGNHDLFGTDAEQASFGRENKIHMLDGNVVELDGLRLAGLSGIVGKQGRRWRRSPDCYQQEVRKLLDQKPDILILHEAPAVIDCDLRGNAELAACLGHASHELVVVCGHCYWPRPLSRAGELVQVLNVDSRAILLHSK